MFDSNSLNIKLQTISEQEEKLAIEKELMLQKALTSDDVNDIFKARNYIRNDSKIKGLQQKTDDSLKTIMVDPMDLNSSLGYKNKSFSISYDILRAMSRTHVIKSIIETRKTQISSYCQPQSDKYSPGFVIQPKVKYTQLNSNIQLSNAQMKKIDQMIDFLINGGNIDNFWSADPFDVFAGKIVTDSLTLDQATAEIVRDNNGVPCEYKATDAATMRKADEYEEDYQKEHKAIKGYYPSIVQVINGQVVNDYYPWEMMFGIRNPSTDIKSNGYGRSELEDMIQTVTALLNADYYNANFFKVGSAPKGILKYQGDINMNTVEQFKSQWVANTAGVMNMHKIPLINADKMEFINLQQSNKDMEFAKFQEFLIKISCALYKIDPSEIGFPMAGSSQQPSFGGSAGNEEKLKYSKDKGLKPLLRYVERWVNKYIIYQIDPNYEFRFVGLDNSITYKEELENNIKELQNFKTLNEIRKHHGLSPIDGGDIVLNPIAFQQYMTMMQQKQQENQIQQDSNPFDEMYGDDFDEQEEQSELENDDNPFTKGLVDEIGIMLSSEISKN